MDLPPGKVLTSGLYGDGAPQAVAWVTVDPVPAAGRVWQQLSGLHHETGPVPILLGTLNREPRRPWDDEEFGDPVDPHEVNDVDAAGFLARWNGPEGPVFLAADGRRLDRHGAGRVVRKVARRAGTRQGRDAPHAAPCLHHRRP